MPEPKPTAHDLYAAQRIEDLQNFYTPRSATRPHLRGAVCSLMEAFVGVREIGRSNRGFWINKFHAEVHLAPGQAWCVMFVQYVYRHAAAWFELPDPLPFDTAGTQALAAWAEKNGLLRASLSEVQWGDLLIWRNGKNSPQGHVGMVRSPAVLNGPGVVNIKTVEGNTSATNYREGGIVAYKEYNYEDADLGKVGPKRYLRCAVSFDALIEKYCFPEG